MLKIHWLGVASVCLALAACDDKGSLGEYPDTEGGSDDAATTTTSTSGTTDDGSGDGATTTTSTTGSTSADSGDSGDTGTPGQCAEEGNCEAFPVDCSDDGCGGLGSVFDEDGCLRQFCSPGECAEGERCYRPESFGGCMGSGLYCEDDFELQMCICSGPADCGGAYCVPEAVYPATDAPPAGAAIATNGCAPTDAETIDLIFGLSSDACDVFAPDPGAANVVLSIVAQDLAVGMYEIGNYAPTEHIAFYDDGTGVTGSAWSALLVIEANDANGLDGWWELNDSADGGVFIGGTFEDLPLCPQDVLCG